MTNELEFLRCGRVYSGISAGPNIKGVLLGKAARYAPDRTFDTLHVGLDLDLDFRLRCASCVCRTTIRAYQDGLRKLEIGRASCRERVCQYV